jgi:hypothetical protein
VKPDRLVATVKVPSSSLRVLEAPQSYRDPMLRHPQLKQAQGRSAEGGAKITAMSFGASS